ncbi:hypothetical protein HY572_05695 [Candidatus Micrarchaeota archaeon]|nr:hypothetical protein [Candidatus Micrarchaeota archaeon]
MRSVLLLALLLGACSAVVQPPHDAVAQHNLAMASSLQGVRVDTGGYAAPSNPLLLFSIQLHPPFPSVDGNVSAVDVPAWVWGWSYDAYPRFPPVGRVDGCGTSQSQTVFSSAVPTFTAHFDLDGVRKTIQNPSNPLRTPFNAEELAAAQSPLQAWLEGELKLYYTTSTQEQKCREECGPWYCWTVPYMEYSHRVDSYPYSGKSNVVSSPVVNPVFEGVLLAPWTLKRSILLPWMRFYWLSNASVYYVETRLDGKRVSEWNRLAFDVKENARGVQYVETRADDRLDADSDVTLKAHVFSPESYVRGYALEQNVFSSRILGAHDVVFEARDVFGHVASKAVRMETFDAARLAVNVSHDAIRPGESVDVLARLERVTGGPLSGAMVRIQTPESAWDSVTNDEGWVVERISFSEPGIHRVTVSFLGSEGFAPVSSAAAVYVESAPGFSFDVIRGYDGLLLALVFVLGLAMVRPV